MMDDEIKKDLQKLLDILWSESEVKVTVKNSLIGGMKIGGCALVGGLLGGPPGLLVGGAIGSIYSWWTSEDFKPLSQILQEKSPAQFDELLKRVKVLLGSLKWASVEGLIAYVMKEIPLKKAIIDEVTCTVKSLK